MTALVSQAGNHFGFGTGIVAKAKIQILAMFLKGKVEEVDISSLPIFHHFAPKQYGRELHMPKGLLIVGKIHKHSHLNIVSRGRCVVQTFEGEVEIVAPATFVSPAGVQRAVHCLEDTVWTTIHTTEGTSTEADLEQIEQAIIATSYDDPALPRILDSTIHISQAEKELIS